MQKKKDNKNKNKKKGKEKKGSKARWTKCCSKERKRETEKTRRETIRVSEKEAAALCKEETALAIGVEGACYMCR